MVDDDGPAAPVEAKVAPKPVKAVLKAARPDSKNGNGLKQAKAQQANIGKAKAEAKPKGRPAKAKAPAPKAAVEQDDFVMLDDEPANVNPVRAKHAGAEVVMDEDELVVEEEVEEEMEVRRPGRVVPQMDED